MKRRAVIAGLGGAAAWPVVARAQSLNVGYLQFGQTQDDDFLRLGRRVL